MQREALAALGSVLTGIPQVQQNVMKTLAEQQESKRSQGRYSIEMEKFNMLKKVMMDDENYINTLYTEIGRDPKYSNYISMLPGKNAYSKDAEGKIKATADFAKLKSMVDKAEEAKKRGITFTPDMNYKIDDWDKLLKGKMSGKVAGEEFAKGPKSAPEYLGGMAQSEEGREAVASDEAKAYTGALQREATLEAAGTRAATPKPKSEEDLTRQLEQDIEDAEAKKTDLKMKSEAQWDAAKRVDKEYHDWLKKTEKSDETGIMWKKETNDDWIKKIQAEKNRAIEFDAQEERQAKFIRTLEAKQKKTEREEEKKGPKIGRFRVKVK